MSRSKYGTIPYEHLGYAIRWEQARAQYFEMVGKSDDAHDSRMKARGYERRAQVESDQIFV
jgi:hypothetical protein